MPWWAWALIICFVAWKFIEFVGGKELERQKKENTKDKASLNKKQKSSLSEDATERLRDRIDDQIAENKYSAALTSIDKLLNSPHYNSQYDSDICASNAALCFEDLAADKTPAQIIKLFDSLKEKNSALDHALQHGEEESICRPFCESLEFVDMTELNATKCAAFLDILESGNELVSLAISSGNAVTVFVNEMGDQLFTEEWQYKEDAYEAMRTLRELLPKPKKRKVAQVDNQEEQE